MECSLRTDVTNALGRTTIVEEYSGPNRLIEFTFTEDHPVYKRYGITSSRINRYKDGPTFYTLEGDIYGQRFEFESNTCFGKNALEELKEFLNNLAQVRKYKPTEFLENVINVTRHIK